MKLINRKEYIEWIYNWKDKPLIKVISGVRRCGKSTLLLLFKNELIKSGIKEHQIISINLEDLKFDNIKNYSDLYKEIESRLIHDEMNYIFIDEIQNVESFEKTVDSLHLRENCDIYITGSNAYFLSSELATLLTGRYVQLEMLPLSFSEFYLNSDQKISKEDAFNLYLENGAFPYVLDLKSDKRLIQQYHEGLYNTLFIKDVIQRNGINDIALLERLTKFLMQNIGSKTSGKKISDTLKSSGLTGDQKTIDKYLQSLKESFLFYEAKRFNVKGRQIFTTLSKYYIVDLGLKNSLVQQSQKDFGHMLENLVYLELRRRGFNVYVGQLESDLEIDFVCIRGNETQYYQVSATTLDEDTLNRELLPFTKVKDNYSKYLLTLDNIQREVNYDGIQKMNLIDWLLDN
ncbi:MAG TPA: ATP-binding protein [Erysipelotrichaceae bacterium]|nr:ATP-binding protein [Erysipelotrichaceae bacterium]